MRVLPALRQLKFLVALADRRHFGQAAEACFVSQSTLSAAIQELEEALGVVLFDRTRRSVAPTGIGLEIAERARTILRQADDLVDVALAARDPLSGPLRLWVIPTITSRERAATPRFRERASIPSSRWRRAGSA